MKENEKMFLDANKIRDQTERQDREEKGRDERQREKTGEREDRIKDIEETWRVKGERKKEDNKT